MEKSLKCTVLLSLKEMAKRSVVAQLWNDSDILASMVGHQMQDESIEDKIKDKLLKLELPKLLTDQMVDTVRHIGLEVRKWKEFHEKSFVFSITEIYEHNPAQLHFTTAGTIDDRRTAEELVRCDRINLRIQRYQMACFYWLEDYIPVLWEQLAEETREHFKNRSPALYGLEVSWPHILSSEESGLDFFWRKLDRNLTSFNQWAFEQSVKMCCKATAEYFFQKLTDEERETSLMKSARATLLFRPHALDERLNCVFFYLLSVMTPEQRMDMVKTCPLDVMSCFLDWPRLDLFSENADLLWTFLPSKLYGNLLDMLMFRYDKRYFPRFFPDFFKQSPPHFRFCFSNLEYGASYFLDTFFTSEDLESIEVMFRTLDVSDRRDIVSHGRVLRLFFLNMLKGKSHLVEVCLREATLSGEDKGRLKEIFDGFIARPSPSHPHTAYGPRELMLRAKLEHKVDPELNSLYDFFEETGASSDKKKK